MGKKRRRQNDPVSTGADPELKKQKVDPRVTDMPNGAHFYQTFEEVPESIQKYWHQGYSIFSKYDEGIWMTDDAWFGVTHECVASKVAEHMAASAPPDKAIIVDAFAGVGGNTIAFALSGRWKRVYAIEKDPATLACAKHNAEIYGVLNQITWFEGDCFDILGLNDTQTPSSVPALREIIKQYGVVFASPPWGGPSYADSETFDLQSMQPYSLEHLYSRFSKMTKNMVLYLPRTSDLNQIADCIDAHEEEKHAVIHYCTKGTSRALCVYFGNWQMGNLVAGSS